MKEEVQLSAKQIILMMVIFVSILIVVFIFFTRNYLTHKEDVNSLLSKEIKGSIVALKDENRGSFYIEIITQLETFRIHSLPIAWEINRYNIQVGDSVSKEVNSNIINFYKYKDGEFIPNGSYEM